MKIFSSGAKPKILVCVLTGIERHNWINSDLMLNLIAMARDQRFDVSFYPVRDCRPWEGARNMTVQAAKQINAEWLISFDNDNFYPGSGTPLDVIAAAGADKHVIGLPSAFCADGGYRMIPYKDHGPRDGQFRQESAVGGSCLMIRNTVWKTIPKGPYFRWVHAESETLAPVEGVTLPEDIYFCELVKKHGFKVWSHERLAGHYRTTDITGLVCTLSQMGQKPR